MKRSTYSQILNSCRAAKKVVQGNFGIRLGERGNYIREKPGCGVCAFGACLVGHKVKTGDEYDDTSDLLGLEVMEVRKFIKGFDEFGISDGIPGGDDDRRNDAFYDRRNDAFYQAGARLAKTLTREGFLVSQ